MQSIATMLRTVPGFDQLDGASLERVAAAGDLAEALAGDVLFREGTLPESLFVLLDGQVSLTGTAADEIEHGDRHPRARQQLRAGERADG